MTLKTNAACKPKATCKKKLFLCPTSNRLLTDKLTLSNQSCNKKVSTANLGMILKVAIEKSKLPTVNLQAAIKKQNHFPMRYEMKTVYKKSTSRSK